MSGTEILVVMTMDCERARGETKATASGPPDYASSARWIEGYARLGAARRLPVTYFIHPETALAHPGVFLDLQRAGACLGLHLHPWKFGRGHYPQHFGGLSAEDQRALLSEGIALFEQALGFRPLYFRPGTFSANDSTYRVLSEMGFRGGSISAPERVYRELCAVWTGSSPDPHRGHRVFRLLDGDLPFADMPLSVDLSRMLEKNGRRYAWDLRPDYAEADYPLIARNIVGQVLARAPAVPVINFVTHNDNDHTDPRDRVSGNLRRVLDAIEEACAAHGATPVGATIETVADRVLARPVAAASLETVGVIHGARSGEAAPAAIGA